MQSLRDKLLQAGVVSQEQVDQSRARAEAEKQARQQKRHAPPPPRPRVESEKDRERRLNRELAERQKAIRGHCDGTEIVDRGEQAFYYRTRKRELRRMYLTPEQVAQLEKGDLAIVDRPNGQDRPHALVPRATAEAILALEERAIRFWAKAPGQSYGFEDEPASAAEQAAATEAGAADTETAPVEDAPAESPSGDAPAEG